MKYNVIVILIFYFYQCNVSRPANVERNQRIRYMVFKSGDISESNITGYHLSNKYVLCKWTKIK